MKCPHCGSEMRLRQEHCPACGKKVTVEFDALAQSIHADAAVRRGERLEFWLRMALILLLAASAVLYGLNDLFDQPLVYDGALVPALPFKETVDAAGAARLPDYADPQPQPPLPKAAVRVFGQRKQPLRQKLREGNSPGGTGGSASEVPKAIDEGLAFLVRSQTKEGKWTASITPARWNQWQTGQFQWGEPGITGLALLAFLGEGETWLPGDDARQKPKYAGTIWRAVQWLISVQDPETGRFGGAGAETVHFMYNHGIATLALAEAAGLSGDESVRAAAQKGVNLIVASQTDEGGWNYWGRRTGDSDTSVSAWQVQALHAAREAGLAVPEETLAKALAFYHKATESGLSGVRVLYSLRTEDRNISRPSLFGVALMIRQLLGEPRGVELKRLGAQLQDLLPSAKRGWGRGWTPNAARGDDDLRARYDPYGLYFAAYGMFFLGGKDWETWHEALRRSVLEMQDNDGCWRCNDTFSKQGGFVYSTALSILTLQACYRIHY